MQDTLPLRYSATVLQNASPQVLSYARAQSLGRLGAQQLLQLQRELPQTYPVLLQSAAAGANNNHDILLAFPGERLTLRGDNTLQYSGGRRVIESHRFLDELDQWWREERARVGVTDLPFSGGWFVYLSYELAGEIEPSLKLAAASANDIVAQATRMPAAIIRDANTSEAWFVAECDFVDKIELVDSHLQQTATNNASDLSRSLITGLHDDDPQLYLSAVRQAKERIAAGDIYQANLSRGWRAQLNNGCTAVDVYGQLQVANPAPFAALACMALNEAIISSSPERLISIREGCVSTRPIAGTRPRSTDSRRDAQLIEELRSNTKEQAEHVMLLDLERNDLGRICKGGTVRVDEFMTVESYAHVHHIVSNVRGELNDNVTPGGAIAAVFPGGTITGCPKVSCMNIIAELEGVSRGAYTGSMGYINRDGSMDLNILIRTLYLKDNIISFRAGAGIVADSNPERELDEARAKALGLLRALGVPC